MAVTALAAGAEAPFVVTLPDADSVDRYRVSFRTDDRIVPHVDRRGRRRDRTHRMKRQNFALIVAAAAMAIVVSLHAKQTPPQNPGAPDPAFRFRSGVELINVTATRVGRERPVRPRPQQDDFIVYEDDEPVEVTHFSAERVPVSLGIALDTSGSMAGEKMEAARGALDRFLDDLLDARRRTLSLPLQRLSGLVQGWTHDRRRLLEPLAASMPNGGTAMYDAVAEAIPLAQQGQNRKKALVVISDGNDTSQPHGHPRPEAADSRERSAGVRGRHRRRSEPTSPRRRSQPPPPHPDADPVPAPRGGRGGGRSPRRSPPAARAAAAGAGRLTIASTSRRCAR